MTHLSFRHRWSTIGCLTAALMFAAWFGCSRVDDGETHLQPATEASHRKLLQHDEHGTIWDEDGRPIGIWGIDDPPARQLMPERQVDEIELPAVDPGWPASESDESTPE